MIEEYRFRFIVINGKAYEYDLELRWTGEVLPWPKTEGHFIDINDIKRAVEQNPETIVIGTGESGMANVSQLAQNFIREKGIKLIIDKTEEAVKTFNVINHDSEEEEGEQEKVIGLFHLTC